MIRLSAGAATDIGQVRTLNEDAHVVSPMLAAVADGMGGHQGGEVASGLVIARFEGVEAPVSLSDLARRISEGNTEVLARSSESSELAGMGTTVCALAVTGEGDRIAIANVGDSRVYVLSAGRLTQITEDHSFVESLVRDGRLTRAQADVHPQRNVLTRALGVDAVVEVDGWEYRPAAGDRFLLCSDGLFNEIDDAHIAEVLGRDLSAEEAARSLVDDAVVAGGRDNVTAVIVDVDGLERDVAAAAGVEMEGADAPTAVEVEERLTRLMGASATNGTAPRAATVAPPPGGRRARSRDREERRVPVRPADAASARRLLTWRFAVFAAAILATVGVAIGAVAWYANRTYVVGIDDGGVAIFEGPRDGLLWFEPRVVPQDIALEELADESQVAELEDGVRLSSRADANDFVNSLILRSATTTTVSTTTTGVATTTAATTTAATTTAATTTTPPAAPAQ